MASPFLFFLLAALAIVASIGMLVARSPVSSALWLVLTMFSLSGIYLTLNATFIGVIQILVYAGAIMVLFLFVIMLLNLSALPQLGDLDGTKILGFILGVAILAQLLYVLALGFDLPIAPVTPAMAAEGGDAGTLGKALFTRYALHLEIAGILLLAATIGAVMLAQRRFQ
ncbi:NADH-quinone oxidoreductase subunit J family protein [Salisaeta longa]|uniref:NADH-quinone oxidoreductase subunit J family protein n=1 Tax=Salisaeta longa TaxID=503170 RepID=UPI0003B46068|nr:NADH-quinone oxidoreductase subunit J [Salisaeta longa]